MSSAPPSSSSSLSNSLTVYEQERQKNIEKNKAVLAELGLGDARRQLIETHKKDVVEKIKRRYTKKSFAIDTPRRSARIQGKPVRYTDGFGSEGEEDRKMIIGGGGISNINTSLSIVNSNTNNNNSAGLPVKRKYSFYDIEDDVGSRPKYKNELTTCHFCRKRDRKPKTRCGTCGIKYWVGDCCRGCFEQHFEDEDFDEVMMNKDWLCYCCRKKCPCLECIAGITKGRRYGPRKFKDTPKEEFTTSNAASFPGVVPEQFSLFSPLPLPSFFNYNQPSNGIPQFNFPVLPQPPHFPPPSSLPSPPHPSSPAVGPPYSHHTSFSSYPTPSLFPSHCSNYTGGFPALQSAFGGGGNGGVSPQNIFGMSPLPPPHPSHPHHYMSSPPFLSPPREGESLANGAMCGYKMAQVIAQITNAPSGYGGSYMNTMSQLHNNSNNNNSLMMSNSMMMNSNLLNNNLLNNNLNLSPPMKKRGRKPKGFNFALHAESVSSDPMSSNDMYEQPLDILPPIKIPKRRGRKPKNRDLPALSVEEEAISMGMSNPEENIDGFGGGPPTPVLTPPPTEKKKRGRPKGSDSMRKGTKMAGRNVMPKKRGRKPKIPLSLSSPSLSPSSEMPCTPSPHPVHFDMNDDDEFFGSSTTNDLLNPYDDEIFHDIDDIGIVSGHPYSHNMASPPSPSCGDMFSNPLGGVESLKVRLKMPSSMMMNMNMNPVVHKKRGRKPKKSNKMKPTAAKEGVEKRKYTKRKHIRDAEDTSNLRRSARPPQANKTFDDHYLL